MENETREYIRDYLNGTYTKEELALKFNLTKCSKCPSYELEEDKPIEKFERFKNEKIVVNVRSQKQYDDFMKMCEEQGLKWYGRILPTKNNVYNDWEEETCINLKNLNNLSYSNINYYKDNYYKIITYKDFIKEESNQFTKSDLKDKLNKIEKFEINYARDIEEKIFYEESDKPNHCILGDAGTELLINKINEIIDTVNKLKKGGN